jgi:hypothetical protein
VGAVTLTNLNGDAIALRALGYLPTAPGTRPRARARFSPCAECHVASRDDLLVVVVSATSDRVGTSREPQGLLAPELRRDSLDGALAQHPKQPRDREQDRAYALPEPDRSTRRRSLHADDFFRPATMVARDLSFGDQRSVRHIAGADECSSRKAHVSRLPARRSRRLRNGPLALRHRQCPIGDIAEARTA